MHSIQTGSNSSAERSEWVEKQSNCPSHAKNRLVQKTHRSEDLITFSELECEFTHIPSTPHSVRLHLRSSTVGFALENMKVLVALDTFCENDFPCLTEGDLNDIKPGPVKVLSHAFMPPPIKPETYFNQDTVERSRGLRHMQKLIQRLPCLIRMKFSIRSLFCLCYMFAFFAGPRPTSIDKTIRVSILNQTRGVRANFTYHECCCL